MNLQDLKGAYLARHALSLDDSAIQHLHGFVAFLEAALAALDPAPAEESAQPEEQAPEAPADDPAPDAQAQEPAAAEAPAEPTPPADPPAA